MVHKIKAYISKGELTVALKNKGNPSKRDISEDYAYVWFSKESIPDKRGICEIEITFKD